MEEEQKLRQGLRAMSGEQRQEIIKQLEDLMRLLDETEKRRAEMHSLSEKLWKSGYSSDIREIMTKQYESLDDLLKNYEKYLITLIKNMRNQYDTEYVDEIDSNQVKKEIERIFENMEALLAAA